MSNELFIDKLIVRHYFNHAPDTSKNCVAVQYPEAQPNNSVASRSSSTTAYYTAEMLRHSSLRFRPDSLQSTGRVYGNGEEI